MQNINRIQVDCTNVIGVDVEVAVVEVAVADEHDNEHQFDELLADVTRDSCCSADDNYYLPKPPMPKVKMNSEENENVCDP
jgi:hypothetical protein